MIDEVISVCQITLSAMNSKMTLKRFCQGIILKYHANLRRKIDMYEVYLMR